MISDMEILLRLLVGAGLGALVGFERERQNQPAGLRTHIILAIGATLAMVLSINLAMQFRDFAPNGDPARLAAQVISGIGFLGAGAILRYGETVKGLTTATSLWTVAIIGLSAGAGNYLVSAGATLLVLIVLTIINVFEKRYIRSYASRTIQLLAEDRPGLMGELKQILDTLEQIVLSINISKDFDRKEATLEAVIRTIEEPDLAPLVEELSKFPGVKSFNIHT
jgi:putative Mg2+ transporter-C (MgtC) family protein